MYDSGEPPYMSGLNCAVITCSGDDLHRRTSLLVPQSWYFRVLEYFSHDWRRCEEV